MIAGETRKRLFHSLCFNTCSSRWLSVSTGKQMRRLTCRAHCCLHTLFYLPVGHGLQVMRRCVFALTQLLSPLGYSSCLAQGIDSFYRNGNWANFFSYVCNGRKVKSCSPLFEIEQLLVLDLSLLRQSFQTLDCPVSWDARIQNMTMRNEKYQAK